MKAIGTLLLAFIFSSFNTNNSTNYNGDCDTYFPLEKGVKWTMNSYNPKGKLESSTTMHIVNTEAIENGTRYVVEGKVTTPKEDEPAELNFDYLCENGVLKMDMTKMIPADMMKSVNESMEIVIDQSELEFPKNMKVGDQLKDANIIATIKSNGTKMFDIKVNITDRKIEKSESITTGAGTFECLKMTSKTNLSMMFMKRNSSSIDWISSKVGVVKSEIYNKKNKLESYSELAAYSKN